MHWKRRIRPLISCWNLRPHDLLLAPFLASFFERIFHGPIRGATQLWSISDFTSIFLMAKAWIPPPKTVGGCMVRLGPNRGVMERILELTSKRRQHEKTDHKFPSYPGKFGKFSKLKTALGVGDMWSFTWMVSIKKSEKSQKKYHTPYIFGQLLAQHGFWPIWVSRDHPDDHTPQGWCNEFQLRFLNLLNQYYHGYIVDPEWKKMNIWAIFFRDVSDFHPKRAWN